MSDIENSLQIKLCYHELSTLWCSFAVQVEYGWTDRCKSTDTTSQKVINWQQSYERHFNVSENENVHINSSHFLHCVRSSITTCCIFYPYVGVYNQSMKSNIQHFWKQLSVLHNIIFITVILSLWTKMVKCSSYQPLVQWCPG